MTPGTLHAFTDGSCYPNPGAGGWGVRLMWEGRIKEMFGGASDQTNNTMELTAILRALEARRKDVPTVIYSDSQYSINCLTAWWRKWERNEWRTLQGKPVKNVGLIKACTPLITPNVAFRWVKGHAGHEHNERVDALALMGRQTYGDMSEGGRQEMTTKEVAT